MLPISNFGFWMLLTPLAQVSGRWRSATSAMILALGTRVEVNSRFQDPSNKPASVLSEHILSAQQNI